jgi:hypothetical protein
MRVEGSVKRWVRKGVEVVLSSASPFSFVSFLIPEKDEEFLNSTFAL